MITVKKCKNADTRSADKKVTREELLNNSAQHIKEVQGAIRFMMVELMGSGSLHDWTKIKFIDSFYKDFELIQNGHVGDFKKMEWFQKYHLQERHHLNDRVPEDVNLFDVLERIADITTAGMARTGKVFDDTLSPDILVKAYKNTIELLKANIKVEE